MYLTHESKAQFEITMKTVVKTNKHAAKTTHNKTLDTIHKMVYKEWWHLTPHPTSQKRQIRAK